MASYLDEEEQQDEPNPYHRHEPEPYPADDQEQVLSHAGPPIGSEANPVGLAELQARIRSMQGPQAAPPQAPPGRFPMGLPNQQPPTAPTLTDGSPMSPDEYELHRIMQGVNQSTLGTARTRQLQRLQNGQATVDDLVMNGTLGPVEAEQYRQMIARQMEPLMIRQSELPIQMQRLQYQRIRMQAAHEAAIGIENERFRATTAQGRMPSAQAADGSTWVQSGNGTWHQARPEQRPQQDRSAITPQVLQHIYQTNDQALTRELAEAAKPQEQGGQRGGLPLWAQSYQTPEWQANHDAYVRNSNAGLPITREQQQTHDDIASPPSVHEMRTRELARRNRQAVDMMRQHLGGQAGQTQGAAAPVQPGAPQAPSQEAPPATPALAAVAAYRQQASAVPELQHLDRPIREMQEILTRYPSFAQAPPAVQARYNYLREFIPRALRSPRRPSRPPASSNPSGMTVAEMPMF